MRALAAAVAAPPSAGVRGGGSEGTLLPRVKSPSNQPLPVLHVESPAAASLPPPPSAAAATAPAATADECPGGDARVRCGRPSSNGTHTPGPRGPYGRGRSTADCATTCRGRSSECAAAAARSKPGRDRSTERDRSTPRPRSARALRDAVSIAPAAPGCSPLARVTRPPWRSNALSSRYSIVPEPSRSRDAIRPSTARGGTSRPSSRNARCSSAASMVPLPSSSH